MAKVFIGCPMHRGELSAATMQSIHLSSSEIHDVQYSTLGLSLLAKNFSTLWIKAWEMGFDYFVLHHCDIACVASHSSTGGTWLDLLVERCKELECAVLSAVPVIKNDAGLTSTALEMVKSDPFSFRRLTIKELNRCPVDFINRADLCEIFGVSEDVAGAMYVNTGLMIMDLKNFDWAGKKWPGFQIDDKVIWSKGGKPSSRTAPEDWTLSRWLHYEAQWPYFATKDLVVHHVGIKLFPNTGDWGQEEDGPRQQCSIEEWENSENPWGV